MSSLQKQFLELVMPRMAIAPNDRILDLGCGDGWACRAMAALTSEGMVVGIDASGDAIREARRLSGDFDNILYIQADAEENPWQDNFFSHVVMIDTLSAFRDASAALRHVVRVMSPGGKLWIFESGDRDAALTAMLLEQLGFAHVNAESAPAVSESVSALISAQRPEQA